MLILIFDTQEWIAICKIRRFMMIYGVGKTLFKVFGRMRPSYLSAGLKKVRDIGVIGCGQFAYATIGYSIWRKYGNRFLACYDVNKENQDSFAAFFGISSDAKSVGDLIANAEVKVVYIASNHASHADYAIEALKAGKIVYVEKPVSVSFLQFSRLTKVCGHSRERIFAGYNRPFSGAVRQLRKEVRAGNKPMTLNCFVSGHMIETDHWYRRPEEGTRICGNVGHWLDLAVHMLSWGEFPDCWKIMVTYSNDASRDDDVAISLASERGDLVNIVLTARSEPFEGINETINFQQGDVIAKIDDFRSMTVWKGPSVRRFNYWPKDVGHNLAIIQPFSGIYRDWKEVEMSTLLMLFIADMVFNAEHYSRFSFSNEISRLVN